MSTTSERQGTLLGGIYDWSLERPDWQRDALRRLIEQAQLTATDTAELTELCRIGKGLISEEGDVPNAVPLSLDDLPAAAGTMPAVTLRAVASVEHVNALAKNQVLSFGAEGLTVIYGDNASGKSGYARILRRACRARNRGASIKPNVYEGPPKNPASAEFDFAIGDSEQHSQWVDGQTSADELSAVSFFDSQCAAVHVSDANSIAFTPFGLDVLEKLAEVCRSIQGQLQTEKRKLEAGRPASLIGEKPRAETSVGKAIKCLSSSSELAGLEKLAILAPHELERLKQLPQDLARDPRKLARELRVRKERLESLAGKVRVGESALSDEALGSLQELAADFRAKSEGAKLAAGSLFSNEPIPKVGSDAWRALWEAARRYSTGEAYSGEDFPVTREGAVCVLCQQTLDESAGDRLKRFEKFVQDDLEAAAAASKRVFREAVAKVRAVELGSRPVRELVQELSLESEGTVREVRRTIVGLRLRRRAILRATETGDWSGIPELGTSKQEELSAVVDAVRKRAEEQDAAARPEERARLELELTELEDRAWLGTVLEDVKLDIARLKKLQVIEQCIRETVTTSITAKSKALADEYVTNRLRDRFVNELVELNARAIKVELARAPGEYGVPNYRIQLIAAPGENVQEVLSEGEHSCTALAGFLAELATANHGSGIVLDDPVCSLDHKWRDAVAKRLVKEAGVRQVVVFTHDIVFLHDLIDYAEDNGVSQTLRRIYASPKGIGTIGDQLPWKTQGCLQRVDELEKRTRAAKQLQDSFDGDGYEKAVREVYGELRETVERAIEEHLFNRVVVRHRDYVNIKQLAKLRANEGGDVDYLLGMHKTCCDITKGHDPSTGRNAAPPDADAMLADVSGLGDWVRGLKDRQKSF